MERKQEPELARAVEELYDGSPTDTTIQLPRSLTAKVSDEQTLRLYGTNFDARYMNEEMLDKMECETQVFKATVEGNVINYIWIRK